MAVGLVLALAQQPVRGAFNGSTSATGNQATTASTFCTTPSSGTVTAVADSYVDQGSPTSTGGGSDNFVVVSSQTGSAQRVYVRFSPLPVVPSRCTVATATLRLFAETQVVGRTLGVYAADPNVAVWTEAGLNWNNKPAALGTAASTAVMPSGDQYVSWSVTEIAKDMYAGANNGFVVRDENETGSAWQQFNSRDAFSNKPQLTVTWN